jgi:hypothetical protein
MKHLQAAVVSSLITVTDAATATAAGTLDCQGADYAVIQVHVTAEANTNSTNVSLDLLENDTTVVTNFATFNAATAVTLDNTAAAVQKFGVDMRGRKRYLRVTVTPDTTTNGAVGISATGWLDKEIKPATAAASADGGVYV